MSRRKFEFVVKKFDESGNLIEVRHTPIPEPNNGEQSQEDTKHDAE